MMLAGMGWGPLSAVELRAWCEGCGESLTPWEFRTLLAMSRAYAGEYEPAKEPARVAPFEEDVEARRERVAKRTFAMLRGG